MGKLSTAGGSPTSSVHPLDRFGPVNTEPPFSNPVDWQLAPLDCLPKRLLEEPLPEGAAAGARLSADRLARMIRSYNLARGWSEEGYLGDAALSDLGLDVALPS